MPAGYTDETADVWLFMYESDYTQQSYDPATVTVDVSPYYNLAVTAEGRNGFVSLARLDESGQEPVTRPMGLDKDGRAVLHPDASYVLTVKNGTSVPKLDYYFTLSGTEKDGSTTAFKCDYCEVKSVVGDENTVYTFWFSARFISDAKEHDGTPFFVYVGKFTVSFRDKDGNELAVACLAKYYSIATCYPNGIGIDGGSYWKDSTTGMSLGKYSDFANDSTLVTGDMILVPQDAVAQVTLRADMTLYAQWTKLVPSLRDGAVFAPEGALLLLAQYDKDGRLASVRSVTVKAEDSYVTRTLAELGLTLPASGTYKLMLVAGDSYAPLCEAWDSVNAVLK